MNTPLFINTLPVFATLKNSLNQLQKYTRSVEVVRFLLQPHSLASQVCVQHLWHW